MPAAVVAAVIGAGTAVYSANRNSDAQQTAARQAEEQLQAQQKAQEELIEQQKKAQEELIAAQAAADEKKAKDLTEASAQINQNTQTTTPQVVYVPQTDTGANTAKLATQQIQADNTPLYLMIGAVGLVLIFMFFKRR